MGRKIARNTAENIKIRHIRSQKQLRKYYETMQIKTKI